MKRNIIISLFCVVALVASCLPVLAIDRDFGGSPLYTLPYDMTIISGPYTITDNATGVQAYPSVFMDSTNSQVNALYDDSLLVLRKSSTLQSSTIGFDDTNHLSGEARIYSVFTNIQSSESFEVDITLRNVPFILDVTKFSIGFNGTINSDLSYADVTVPVIRQDVDGTFTNVIVDYGSPTYPNIDGNVFDLEFWQFLEEIMPEYSKISPDCMIIPEVKLHYVIYGATGNISYSLNRFYTQQYDVSVGNHVRQAFPNLPNYGFSIENNVYPTYLDGSLVDWLGDAVDSVMSIEIFPNVTLSALIWSVLGVGIAVMFIKFFAGG